MGYIKLFIAPLCMVGFTAVRGQPADTLIVHFAFNKAVLQPRDRKAIDSRLSLSGRPVRSISLAGYCDSIGGDRYNDGLSQQRIAAVKAYMRSLGVPDTLFKTQQPFGRRKPLNDNGDEEKRSLNRRVLIVWRRAPNEPPAIILPETDTTAAIGRNIDLNIQFYQDMHHPMPASFLQLHALLTFMRAHPGLRIEIRGYVCCMPDNMDGFDTETKKYDLSVQRAKFVYAYLADHGIDPRRMSFKGFGGADKIYPGEEDNAEKLANRRVEMKILSWKGIN